MKKSIFIVLAALVMVIMASQAVLAAHTVVGDRQGGWDKRNEINPETGSAYSCGLCHPGDVKRATGPHGGYNSGTSKCLSCHGLHEAQSALLLPGATVTAVCNFCHDLTESSNAPYSAYGLSSKDDIKASHRVFGTVAGTTYNAEGDYGLTVIPGGDYSTGGDGSILANTTGAQGTLSGTSFTCDSCHTPHGLTSNTVYPYLGDNPTAIRVVDGVKDPANAGNVYFYLTNRLLKKKVNNVTTDGSYDGGWCAGCHQGRTSDHAMTSGGAVYNHPVDTSRLAYDFLGLGLKNGVTLTGSPKVDQIKEDGVHTVVYLVYYIANATTDYGERNLTGDPRSNKYYTMEPNNPEDGVARPDGSLNFNDFKGAGPACQQCHANPRDIDAGKYVTNLATIGIGASNAGAAIASPGPGAPTMFTFPHISTNPFLLDSTGDDLCMNCHGTSNLP